MRKYREALFSITFTMHHRVKPKYLSICEDENLEILRELVEKDKELQSRKGKLVVGSEWECVVECYVENTKDGEFYSIEVGQTVLIINVTKNLVEFRSDGIRIDNIEHFQLCFKPKEPSQ